MDSQQITINQSFKKSKSITNKSFSNNQFACVSLEEELDKLLRNLDYKNIELLKGKY